MTFKTFTVEAVKTFCFKKIEMVLEIVKILNFVALKKAKS